VNAEQQRAAGEVVERWRALSSARRALVRDTDAELARLIDRLALAEWAPGGLVERKWTTSGDVIPWWRTLPGDVVRCSTPTHPEPTRYVVTESRPDDSRPWDAGTWRVVASSVVEDEHGTTESYTWAADVRRTDRVEVLELGPDRSADVEE
jgi:hypothetical protein